MTRQTYAEIIDSANNSPAELFAFRWLLMPEAKDISGVDPENLDVTKQALLALHNKLTRSVADIRADAGLSQKQFANYFAIPVSTVRNWEARNQCAIYIRLMMAQILGQFDPVSELGLEA